MMKQLILPMLFLLGGLRPAAQSLEFGVAGGVFLYSGDLSPREFGIYFPGSRPAYGGLVRLSLSPWLSVRLAGHAGELMAEDANTARGLNFRTRLSEVHLAGEVNLFHIGAPDAFLRLTPYLVGGIGVFRFNPEGRLDGNWIGLQPLGTEGQGLPGYDQPYSLTQVNFPVGLGLKIIAASRVTLALEVSGRKILTDYLDDVSNVRVTYGDVLNGNGLTAARLSQPFADPESSAGLVYKRGGPFDDWYHFAGLMLTVSLGGDKQSGRGSRGKGREAGCYRF